MSSLHTIQLLLINITLVIGLSCFLYLERKRIYFHLKGKSLGRIYYSLHRIIKKEMKKGRIDNPQYILRKHFRENFVKPNNAEIKEWNDAKDFWQQIFSD